MATVMIPEPLPETAVMGLVAELDPAKATVARVATMAIQAADTAIVRCFMRIPFL
jgi:hypothetical protein